MPGSKPSVGLLVPAPREARRPEQDSGTFRKQHLVPCPPPSGQGSPVLMGPQASLGLSPSPTPQPPHSSSRRQMPLRRHGDLPLHPPVSRGQARLLSPAGGDETQGGEAIGPTWQAGAAELRSGPGCGSRIRLSALSAPGHLLRHSWDNPL